MLSPRLEVNDPRRRRKTALWRMRCALGCAVLGMLALHVVQAELDPLTEPISFYVHGRGGWLLILSFTTFAAASLELSCMVVADRRRKRALQGFALGMLVTAFVPSDLWFPWEQPPTWHGLVHAATAMAAPLLLLAPMYGGGSRERRPQAGFLVAYVGALFACAVSLAVGFAQRGAPPYIGLAERMLALVAVAWIVFAVRRA